MPLSAYLELFKLNGLLIINWSILGRIKFLSAPSFTSGTCMDITVIMSQMGYWLYLFGTKTAYAAALPAPSPYAVHMTVMRLSGEPPCDPNQMSASPVIDYKWLTPCEAKETHPIIHSNYSLDSD